MKKSFMLFTTIIMGLTLFLCFIAQDGQTSTHATQQAQSVPSVRQAVDDGYIFRADDVVGMITSLQHNGVEQVADALDWMVKHMNCN